MTVPGVTSKRNTEYTPTEMMTSWNTATMAATAMRHSRRIDR